MYPIYLYKPPKLQFTSPLALLVKDPKKKPGYTIPTHEQSIIFHHPDKKIPLHYTTLPRPHFQLPP